MGEIRINVDTSALDEALKTLGAAGGRAVARAVNLTTTSVRRRVLREISQQVGLPQRRLARSVRSTRVAVGAAGKAAGGRRGAAIGGGVRATASIFASGSDIDVTAFGARKLKSGAVSFSPGRKAKRRRIPGAFFATMKSGHEGVFMRATGASNVQVDRAERFRRTRRVRKTGSDVPIAKLVLPGVSSVMLDAALQTVLQRDGEETLKKSLAAEVKFELLKATGRVSRRKRR